jgi:rRNA-processing protein EBP2
MVKKFQKVNRKEDRDDLNNEEEELSDLEIDNQDKVLEEEINDVEALEAITARMKDDFHKIMKSKDIDWLETMHLTADQAINPDLNIDDDIRRELIFYNISLKNAAKGINKLKERNQKLNRPDDFFAEMVKSDSQMERIKKQIVTEQIRIKKFEERKQKMQNVKFAKAVGQYLTIYFHSTLFR